MHETLQARAALEGLSAGLAARQIRDGAAATAARDRLVVAEVHRLDTPPRARAYHGPRLDAILAGDEAQAADAARRHVLDGIV